jgi:coenzyme F420 hydrogenase subunit beta
MSFICIRKTVQDDLCTGCGACVAVCPTNAVRMIKHYPKGIYIPKINHKKCNLCGLCSKVCPGRSVDFIGLNLEFFGKKSMDDLFLGNYLKCYMGHGLNYEIRYNSSSGGIITSLLVFAMEKGIIKGALVTRMRKGNPLEPEVTLAKTKEDIVYASGSKYCPVPLNTGLKKILNEHGKFAIVGLPCHIHAIRKAELINERLRKKIALHIGLFCGHTPNFLATEFLLKQIAVKKTDITEISYRGRGWPGRMMIKLKGGNEKLISFPEYYSRGFGSFFYPVRCTLCCDLTCELADLSCGDAWLPELAGETTGKSIIISRNAISERILNSAKVEKVLELEQVSPERVIKSQRKMLYSKKQNLQARLFLFRLLKRELPDYNSLFLKAGFIDYPKALWFYTKLKIGSERSLWNLVNVYTYIRRRLIALLLKIMHRKSVFYREE